MTLVSFFSEFQVGDTMPVVRPRDAHNSQMTPCFVSFMDDSNILVVESCRILLLLLLLLMPFFILYSLCGVMKGLSDCVTEVMGFVNFGWSTIVWCTCKCVFGLGRGKEGRGGLTSSCSSAPRASGHWKFA